MNRRSEIESILRASRPRLMREYDIESLGIFGSYARDEQTPISDLDVLVSFRTKPSLLRFIELENHLSELLKVRVDLVMNSALKPRLAKSIRDQVIML